MILADVTPLQTGHRYRGIGVYVAGVFTVLTQLWADEASFALGDLGLLRQPLTSTDDPFVQVLHAGGERRRTVTAPKPPWRRDRLQWLVTQPFFAATLAVTRPALYHSTDVNGLVRVPGIPTMATLYDLIPLHYPDEQLPLRWLDQRLGYRRYLEQLRRVEHIVAISEATKQDAVERLRLRPERISVTPLGVDAARFAPPPDEEARATRVRYGLSGPYFLYVGSADPHKNVARVVGAFVEAARALPAECVLAIAGKWSALDVAAVESLYRRRGGRDTLRFLGFVPEPDLPALYGEAVGFVYPSLIEGFGLPVLEAMAAGTVVITSDRSSLCEAAGDAALLVDPRDENAIGAALVQAAGDNALRTKLRARGQARAATFTWSATARKTLDVYCALLS